MAQLTDNRVLPQVVQENRDRPASSGDLAVSALRGLKWTYLATLCSSALQIGVTATMSRLLTPADYGLIAAAGLFLRFGSYFSEMGVGQALVQKLTVDEQDISAAFTASTGIGLLAAAAMWVCAPLARVILDTASVVNVVRLLAFSLALNGMASTSLNLLRRQLRFDVLSKIEVASYALSYGLLGIPLALVHCGVWALTAALLCQPLLTLCFAYGFQKHRLHLSLRWSAHRTLLSFGSKLSFTSFAEYIFFFAEPSVVGRMWGGVVLGIYNRASILANLPGSNLSSALMKVLFPVFSRAQDDIRRLGSAYLQGLAAMSLITAPVAIGMIPAARDIVLTIVGTQYTSAVPLLQILVLALPIGMSAAVAATITNVRGEVGRRLLRQIALCVLMWIALFVAARWGIRAMVLASVVTQGVRLIAFHALAQKSLRLRWREVMAAVSPGILFALLVSVVIIAVSWGLSGMPPLVRLISEIGAAGLVWVLFCVWCLPRQVTPFVVRVLDASKMAERFPAVAKYRTRIVANLPGSISLSEAG